MKCARCNGRGFIYLSEDAQRHVARYKAERVTEDLVRSYCGKLDAAVDISPSLKPILGFDVNLLSSIKTFTDEVRKMATDQTGSRSSMKKIEHAANTPPRELIPFRQPKQIKILKKDGAWPTIELVTQLSVKPSSNANFTHELTLAFIDEGRPGQREILDVWFRACSYKVIVATSHGQIAGTAKTINYTSETHHNGNKLATLRIGLSNPKILAIENEITFNSTPSWSAVQPRASQSIMSNEAKCHICGEATIVKGSDGRPEHPTCGAWGK